MKEEHYKQISRKYMRTLKSRDIITCLGKDTWYKEFCKGNWCCLMEQSIGEWIEKNGKA